MRRRIFLICLILIGMGCSDHVEFNIPAIQGYKDGEIWKAVYQAADIDFGGLVIEGGNNAETLLFVTVDDGRGTYTFGPNSPNEPRFKDANGVVYSTKNAPDPSVSVYPPDGRIVIQSFDNNATPKTLTGTFWFNAYTADGLHRINFNEGHVYRVPLVGGLDATTVENTQSEELTCQDALIAVGAAALNFYSVNTSSSDYTPFCNHYKNALQLQKDKCGDPNGNLQGAINNLGDCSS